MKIVELIITHGALWLFATAALLKAWLQFRTARRATTSHHQPAATTASVTSDARSPAIALQKFRQAAWRAARLDVLIMVISFACLTLIGFWLVAVTPFVVVASCFFSGQFFFSLWSVQTVVSQMRRDWGLD